MGTSAGRKALPIWQVESAILDALRGARKSGSRLVLAAPTGSGKSTQVPQMLVDSLGCKRVVVLQPRRVAARTLAARVAAERNSRLGQEVGYQIRFEDYTSRGTRISFVTEGILLRWLQDDPTLEGIDAIIFDEFHERNLLSDVALGLVKSLQKNRGPELRVIVMSATLDTTSVAKYLGDCPVVISEGTMFAVEVNYLPFGEKVPIAQQAAEAVTDIINRGEVGDVLVFMPGMGEIQATLAELRNARVNERLALIPLHGELPPDEQDRAFAENALRKVVVSTNVAETSVTIPGVRHVVDSGLARVARYDAERGIGTLLIEEISRASSDQRKGRAGRTAPGTCRRLWTESNHLNRPERNTPEIQRADLAEVVLLLHSLGIRQAAEFGWLDKPDPQAVERAEKLLEALGAISIDAASQSDLTEIGRKMLRLPMHPRYSRMLVEAARYGCVKDASLCAALVSGRDLLVRLSRDDKHIATAREQFEASDQSDFFVLIEGFKFAQRNGFNIDACRRYGVHALAAQQVALTWQQIYGIARSHLGDAAGECSAEMLQRCILTGFVDQFCVRKDQGTLDCLLTEGRTGTLARESVAQKAPHLVVGSIREVSGKQGNLTLLGLATAVKLEWLRESFPRHFSERIEYVYDPIHKRVAAIRYVRFLDLVVAQEHQKELDPVASGRALAQAYFDGLFELPLFNHELKQFIARVNLIAKAAPDLEFPVYDSAALKNALARAFHGLTLAKETQGIELRNAIRSHLAPEQVAWVDELAPSAIAWPNEKKQKLLYSEDLALNPPELQVKLHECFGATEHPRLCEGRVSVKTWLCQPDGKRIQSTSDWPQFRAREYPKLKPALQKKFPGFTWL
ncbi:MAG TPA: ATP-dependent helicase HrpB [Verrucomicrobiae bacterium]|nr:ATP-dependent helicase HrpB [Verrucomicrobiae bacterium]